MTPTQLWMLRQIAHSPVPYDTFRKWDQRPLAGLWRRGLTRLVQRKADILLECTQTGWDTFKMTTHAKLRKNPEAPLFKAARTRAAMRNRKSKAV